MIERRLAELHMSNAAEKALRLFCASSTIIPEEFKDRISEIIAVDIMEFALHARRVNDLCDLKREKFSELTPELYDTKNYPSTIETNYHYAINRLIHAKKFIVGYSRWSGQKIFLKSENELIPTYIEVETDNHDKACIKIFSLANCFTTEVATKVREKFPNIIF